MRFCSREEQDKEAAEIIQAYRDAAGLFPIIRKAARDFDGKIYNCRLIKAIQAEQEKRGPVKMRIYSEKRGSLIDLHTYHKGQFITLATLKFDDMEDGKRINADKLIESATEHRTRLLQDAASIEQIKNNVDVIKSQIEQVKRLMESVTKDINYTAADIYGLRARFTAW